MPWLSMLWDSIRAIEACNCSLQADAGDHGEPALIGPSAEVRQTCKWQVCTPAPAASDVAKLLSTSRRYARLCKRLIYGVGERSWMATCYFCSGSARCHVCTGTVVQGDGRVCSVCGGNGRCTHCTGGVMSRKVIAPTAHQMATAHAQDIHVTVTAYWNSKSPTQYPVS